MTDGANSNARKEKSIKRGNSEGQRIYLRSLTKADLVFCQRWSEDPEIRKLIGEIAPMSRAETEKWYSELRADKDRLWFAVVLKKGARVIGEAGFLRMFKPWRCTDMTMIIGEKDAWGRGYGMEAGRLLLNHVFTKLKFHRVSVGVVGFNYRAIRYWEKLGFKKEGIERDSYYCDGKYSDFIMMSILENEFKTSNTA